MAQQLNTDVQTCASHKYTAHQTALFYVSEWVLVAIFPACRGKEEWVLGNVVFKTEWTIHTHTAMCQPHGHTVHPLQEGDRGSVHGHQDSLYIPTWGIPSQTHPRVTEMVCPSQPPRTLNVHVYIALFLALLPLFFMSAWEQGYGLFLEIFTSRVIGMTQKLVNEVVSLQPELLSPLTHILITIHNIPTH